MDSEFLLKKLEQSPKGFGVKETAIWLKDIPNISTISEIESFLQMDCLTKDEWFALIVILRQKYINSMLKNEEIGSCYEQYILNNQQKESYETLFLEEDKSRILDFSKLKITKLQLSSIRRCEEILLPQSLEMLEVCNAPKLISIKGTEHLTKIKYLSVSKCNKVSNFNFIANLKQLLILDLSLNSLLPELNFLNETLPVVILQLVCTNAIKYSSTINNLSKLQKLKDLSIKANLKQLEEIRKTLPNVVVNGIAALNTIN